MNSSETMNAAPVHGIVRSGQADGNHTATEIVDVWEPLNQLFSEVDHSQSIAPLISNALRVVEWSPSSTSK